MLLQIKLCLFAMSLKIIVMANLIHDYSKPSKVDKLLREVFSLLASYKECDVTAARELIGSARELLDSYLASDNLIDDAGVHYSR